MGVALAVPVQAEPHLPGPRRHHVTGPHPGARRLLGRLQILGGDRVPWSRSVPRARAMSSILGRR